MRYRHHLFLCINERHDGPCCAALGAADVLRIIKGELRRRGLDREGGIMANKSGCFGLCTGGPHAVVYPAGTWHIIRDAGQAHALIDTLEKDVT
jgi:(2Fe-2S) ferredoxin